MTHTPTGDYYCAQRDSQGHIRLNCGRGLLVANSDNTRADVQTWLDNAGNGTHAANYRAALNLFDQEDPGTIAPEELTSIFKSASKASRAKFNNDPRNPPTGIEVDARKLMAIHHAAGLQAIATSAVEHAMRRGYQDGNVTMIASDDLKTLRQLVVSAREAGFLPDESAAAGPAAEK